MQFIECNQFIFVAQKSKQCNQGNQYSSFFLLESKRFNQSIFCFLTINAIQMNAIISFIVAKKSKQSNQGHQYSSFFLLESKRFNQHIFCFLTMNAIQMNAINSSIVAQKSKECNQVNQCILRFANQSSYCTNTHF